LQNFEMAKAKNPINVSRHFSISEANLNKFGVLNATLAIDTKLFIDPLLLRHSKHREIRIRAVQQYVDHFNQIIALLRASKTEEDAAWKAAKRQLRFPEIRGTCLGYGGGSIHGSGWGEKLTSRVLKVAKEIVDIGVSSPDLFTALALFEADIGPDRISDMTTNIVFESLADYNARVLLELGIEGESFTLDGSNRSGTFLRNPFEPTPTPIILVPRDILRDLPVAHDWDSVVDAAKANAEHRDRVNLHIAELWATKTKRDKAELKSQALRSKGAFETLLLVVNSADSTAYDAEHDPNGLVLWAQKGHDYASKYPIQLCAPTLGSIEDLLSMVKTIIAQFRHLIERCGLNKELYVSGRKPRHESTAQRLFFAVAFSYCKANNLDISPEIDTGNGKVDFKFSQGFEIRVLVEIKLSTNSKIKSGYSAQLEEYKDAQLTSRAVYLVIDVGRMSRKDQQLVEMKNEAAKAGKPLSELEFVDGIVRESASNMMRRRAKLIGQ
jgi:hypothetical protein